MSTFNIQFTATPGAIPPTTRMRRLLKFALRSCGMRCTAISPGTELEPGNVTDTRAETPQEPPNEKTGESNKPLQGILGGIMDNASTMPNVAPRGGSK